MNISFRCPKCQKEFRVDAQYGGRQWACTSCATPILIPEANQIQAARPETPLPVFSASAEPEIPIRSRRREEDFLEEPPPALEWASFRTGLHLLNIGQMIFCVAYVVFIFVSLMALAQVRQIGFRRSVWEDILGATAVVLILAALAYIILWIIGLAMGCTVPGESGAKALIIVSLVLTVVSFLFAAIGFLVLSTTRNVLDRSSFPLVLILFALIIALVGHIILIVALRNVAVYFQRGGLAGSLLAYLIVILAFVVINIILSVISPMYRAALGEHFPGQSRESHLALGIFLLLLQIGLMAWFIVLLALTRGAVPRVQYRRRFRERPEY